MVQKSGQISVTAPSNIAFVKYWGKHGRQLPNNPSVSMTLQQCTTSCSIRFEPASQFELVDYQFEGKANAAFQQRMANYLVSITDLMPILNNMSISIESHNSFPHSAGIASSASAFAAIGYALANIENGETIEQRASELARLGSGSAARSIAGPYTIWGDYAAEQSSVHFASQLEDVHTDFADVCDTILLIDSGEKKVSSSAGHALIEQHCFRDARIEQALNNTQSILSAMRAGDWQLFGETLEHEALTLHALMMTSQPSVMLLQADTLKVIEKITDFRQQTGKPVYFTIDAGPNVHMIYPASEADAIGAFIAAELVSHCQDGKFLTDRNGKGAQVVNETIC